MSLNLGRANARLNDLGTTGQMRNGRFFLIDDKTLTFGLFIADPLLLYTATLQSTK